MRLFLMFVLGLLSSHANAQTQYGGLEAGPIKALSDKQIADLSSGGGMGLALTAELNGYPGPSHVLELSEKLKLSRGQHAKVEALFKEMKVEAVPVGLKLVEQEAALEAQFASGKVTPTSLKRATAEIASVQGLLRETHLKYHLSTAIILDTSQIQKYAELRGYAEKQKNNHKHH